MLKNKQQNLENNILFAEFNTIELAQISEHSRYQVLAKDQLLFQQGQKAMDFFINIDGKIKLALLSMAGNEKVMSVVNKDQSFAEAIMFLDNKTYPLNATALVPSTVLCINSQVYMEVLQ